MSRDDEAIPAQQVADELGIKLHSFLCYRSDGRGPVSYKRGKNVYVLRSDLDAFLAAERQRTRRGEGVGV
ncbi:hypothetical protein BH10ACT9_BH10ACT9_35470 [soil metagenome]